MPNGYDHPHFHIRFKGKKEAYKSPLRVIPPEPPPRIRKEHATHLQEQYSNAITALTEKNPDAEGFYLKFTVPATQGHIVENLENQKKQIEVLAVKQLGDGATVATVFIPEAQQNFFPAKFDAYRTKDTKTGRPKNNDLIARIETIEPAQFQDLFVAILQNAGLSVMAPEGGLSPRSRTSMGWSRQWPIRPDIVLEGGNFAHDGQNEQEAPQLKLVTTNNNTAEALFCSSGDTSGASALATRMAAMLMERYPNYWPETIRALIIHSADWTEAMKNQAGGVQTKQSKNVLLRRFGYGLPDFDRAAASADNHVSLVIEDVLQPFRLDAGSGKNNQMALHRLPWPRAELQAAGAIIVRIKITLSYFIEPNPGKAWSRKHAYQSHALRFAFKRATETFEAFRARVNAAIEAEESGSSNAGDGWFLGSLRNGGSLHSDTWEVTAAELAEMDAFGIYPIGGWWKNNPKLGKINSMARYAAIVSIKAPANLSIYTPIGTLIKQDIEIEI